MDNIQFYTKHYKSLLCLSVRISRRSAGTKYSATLQSYCHKYLKVTSLQLEPNTKSPLRSIPDADIPEEARVQLQELLDRKYINIVSQTTTDIGRTNLIELDIPTEGTPIAFKPYTVPLTYPELMDHEVKHLEKVGKISWKHE